MAREAKVRRKVYSFIKEYKAGHDGHAPTYDEISQHFKWKNPMNAWNHVRGLERDKLLYFDERRRIVLFGGEYIPPNF
jgi:hypothetical protein